MKPELLQKMIANASPEQAVKILCDVVCELLPKPEPEPAQKKKSTEK